MKKSLLVFVAAMVLGVASYAQKSESFKTLCEAYQTAYSNYLPGYLYKLDTTQVSKNKNVSVVKDTSILTQSEAEVEFKKAMETAIRVAFKTDFGAVVEFVSKTAKKPQPFVLKLKSEGPFFKEEQTLYESSFQKILKQYNSDPSTFDINLYTNLLYERFKKKRDASLKTLMSGK